MCSVLYRFIALLNHPPPLFNKIRYLRAKEHVHRGTKLAAAKKYAEALPLFAWVVLSGYTTLAATIRLDLMADTVHNRIKHQPGECDSAALYVGNDYFIFSSFLCSTLSLYPSYCVANC